VPNRWIYGQFNSPFRPQGCNFGGIFGKVVGEVLVPIRCGRSLLFPIQNAGDGRAIDDSNGLQISA
jgi:hypothetical protein